MTRRRTDLRIARLAARLDQAARIKPNLDQHLATRLAYCDTKQHNETGISAPGLLSDPTMAAIMARASVTEKAQAIETALSEIEACVNALDRAMRKAWGNDRPAIERDPAPICYNAGCTREVGSYLRADGSVAYRLGGEYGGLCDTHRMQAIRETSTT